MKTVKVDYHIHTEDSYDSNLKSTDLVEKAILLGYNLIAITEHLDLLPQEMGKFGTPSLSRYLSRLDGLKASYPELKILKGIEVGDFQQHSSFAQRLLDHYAFDLVLGSVHFLKDHTNLAIPIRSKMDKARITEYYQSNLDLVQNCHIHVLSHLGVYKRFFGVRPEESYALPLIKDIFSCMIDKGIALEINYACGRKVYKSIIPESDYLELYIDMGGKLFTIASDAHHIDHFEDYLHLVPADLLARFRISDRPGNVLELVE